MASLLTTGEQYSYAVSINDLFDTFKRTVVAYKTTSVQIVSQDSANHNFAFGGQQKAITTKSVITSGVFDARVIYKPEQTQDLAKDTDSDGNNSDLRGPWSEGEVKIKVKQSGYNFIKDCNKIEIDGASFVIATDVRPKPIFGYDTYYSFVLKGVK